jgi:dihydrofolate reductase
MKVRAIVIKSLDGVIAVNDLLPWKYKEDMDRFRALTRGAAVLMGRKTWDGLYIQPLPNRYNIVVSRYMLSTVDVKVVRTLQSGLNAAVQQNKASLWVIGGAEIYNAFAYRIDEWYVTEVEEIIGQGLKLPPLDKAIWECTSRVQAETFNGVFKTYKKLRR